jgi:protein phosphatase PTC7
MRGLRFIARAACAMPHPDKVSRGGEDGFYIAADGKSLGVADGVGGWADQGVNPAFFTWCFMKRCLAHASADAAQRMPLGEVMQKAWSETVAAGYKGSCTTAVASFESDGSSSDEAPLDVMLVGDCGAIVVRGETVVLRTKERQYKFNFPHQIGHDGRSAPKDLAGSESVKVRADDVVILGSDGVFDNVFDAELVGLVKASNKAAAGKAIIDCQALADSVAKLASDHGADSRYKSPFSVAAQKAGYRYIGGKQDDVCVVVGVVGAADEAAVAAGQPAYKDVESYFKWAGKPCAAMPPPRPAGRL